MKKHKISKMEIYKRRLLEIKSKKGKLKTIYVVEDARSLNSPLHSYFEWNNTKAGHLYRMEQARKLIQSCIDVIIIDDEPKQMRSFFNIGSDDDDEQVYVTIREAIANKDYRQQVLNKLIQELEYTTDLMRAFKKIND